LAEILMGVRATCDGVSAFTTRRPRITAHSCGLRELYNGGGR
jgi:hypothetical protein